MSLLKPQKEITSDLGNSNPPWSIFVVLILTSLFCLANNIADPDLWGHVQFGRDVIETGTIQPTTTYSFTANGYRWINHENLSELVLALTYDNFGVAGLILGKFILALLILSLIIFNSVKNGVGLITSGMVALLVSINLTSFWHFRPQVSSFVCCAILLFLLESCFRDWRSGVLQLHNDTKEIENAKQRLDRKLKWLWFAPVVLFVWSNSHGGFVAGLAILGVYLFGRSVELMLAKGRNNGMQMRLIFVGSAAALSTLINPYGPDLHLWLLNSLGEPRPEIQDWLAVDFTSTNGIRFSIVLAVSLLAISTSKFNQDWTKIAVLILVAWQACCHVRHVAFFALLFGFWLPVHIQSIVDRIKVSMRQNRSVDGVALAGNSQNWVAGFLSLILLAGIGYRMQDMPVDKADYPVAAFDYISDKNLSGRLVVTYNWAQYAIGAFGGEHIHLPLCPVSFDGRFRTCYPQEIVDMNFDFVIFDEGPDIRFRGKHSGPVNPTRVLEFGSPELVLISRRQHPAVQIMSSQTENWCILYQDEIAQLWGIKSRFDDPTSSSFIASSQRVITDREQDGSVTWPALPQKTRTPEHSKSALASNHGTQR